MNVVATIIFLGCANWLSTLILCESELFKPTRGFLDRKADFWTDYLLWEKEKYGHNDRRSAFVGSLWKKIAYLHGCHLCCGTWVGIAIAVATPTIRPFGGGFVGLMLAGLVYKAIGHIVLETTGALQRTNSGAHE
jgi:hypothetical protein